MAWPRPTATRLTGGLWRARCRLVLIECIGEVAYANVEARGGIRAILAGPIGVVARYLTVLVSVDAEAIVSLFDRAS